MLAFISHTMLTTAPRKLHLRLIYQSPSYCFQHRHFSLATSTAGAVAAVSACAAPFLLWRRRQRQKYILDTSIKRIQVQKGVLCYRVHHPCQHEHRSKTNKAALFFHSTPGGYDQFSAFDIKLNNLPLICPSRPGYLSTDISCGTCIADHVSSMEELVGTFEADCGKSLELHVLAMGGGAPYALEYARRNDSKVQSLILIEPITRMLNVDLEALCQQYDSLIRRSKLSMDIAEFYSSLLLHFSFGAYISMVLREQLAYNTDEDVCAAISKILADPSVKSRYASMMGYALFSERVKGYIQDMKILSNINNDFPRDRQNILASIKTPTLLIHSKMDANVNYREFSEYAATYIPNATLQVLEGDPHMVFLTQKRLLEDRINKFIVENSLSKR